MDIQAMVDAMSKCWAKERAATQMTLGKLIDFLKTQPAEKKIVGFGEANSYRGYYSDLSFEPSSEEQLVGNFLEYCQSAMGEIFEGYKGGDFVMGRNTPLWIAGYGSCGSKLMELQDIDGVLHPVTKEDE